MDAAKETVLVFLATCLLKQRDAEKNNIKCVPEPRSNIKHESRNETQTLEKNNVKHGIGTHPMPRIQDPPQALHYRYTTP